MNFGGFAKPKTRKTVSSPLACRLSIRNHIYSDIIAAMEIVGAENHVERLKDRADFRRKWLATYRNIYRNRPKKLKAK